MVNKLDEEFEKKFRQTFEELQKENNLLKADLEFIKNTKKKDMGKKFEEELNEMTGKINSLYITLNEINKLIPVMFEKGNDLERAIYSNLLKALGNILIEIGNELTD